MSGHFLRGGCAVGRSVSGAHTGPWGEGGPTRQQVGPQAPLLPHFQPLRTQTKETIRHARTNPLPHLLIRAHSSQPHHSIKPGALDLSE